MSKPYRNIVGIMAIILLLSLWSISNNVMSRSAENGIGTISSGASVNAGNTSTIVGKSVRKIVIDAGHGGKDPGAEGASGNLEKLVTLDIATKVANILDSDPSFDVYMTREDDTFITLEDRPRIANEIGADAFVSIHGNTYTDPDISGTETYYYEEDDIKLSEFVHKELVEALGFHDRGVRQEEWKVLTHSDVPSILLELGYLTNANEEAALLDEDTQIRTAQAIVTGLKDYFASIG
jgi:N-acetylmuramoyl-L-alanine amidase